MPPSYVNARTLCSAAIAVLLLVGCSDTDDTAEDSGPNSDPDACTTAVVPHRFGFSWERLNHRVSKWDVQLEGADEDACEATTLGFEAVGGTFSGGMNATANDTPTLKYGFRTLRSEEESALGFARRSMNVTIDASGVARGTETFSRNELKLRHYPNIVALVEGFRIDTDVDKSDGYPQNYDPAHGYTVRSIGAGVGVADLSKSEIELDYELTFGAGTSYDRGLLNRAVPHAAAAGRLDVLLVGVSNVPVTSGNVEYAVDYPAPPPEPVPPASKKKRRLSLRGAANKPLGIWGVRSFRFELIPRIDCDSDRDCAKGESCRDQSGCTAEQGEPGVYVRDIVVDIELEGYDRSRGEADFLVNGFATNASDFLAFWPLRNSFRSDVVWIQAEGASETVRYDSPFETGRTEVPLETMRE